MPPCTVLVEGENFEVSQAPLRRSAMKQPAAPHDVFRPTLCWICNMRGRARPGESLHQRANGLAEKLLRHTQRAKRVACRD